MNLRLEILNQPPLLPSVPLPAGRGASPLDLGSRGRVLRPGPRGIIPLELFGTRASRYLSRRTHHDRK